MIRLQRHDQSVPREDDEAVRLDDIIEEFKKKFDGAFAMVNYRLDIFSAKRRSTNGKVSILFEP